MSERRIFSGELRAEGRRLSGDVLVFGDVSPSHRERFEPGSIQLAEAVHLDLHHEREKAVAWHPGGGLDINIDDRAMTMRAEVAPIPAGDRALAEVREGRATGLSVEFHALAEKREAGVRVISSARVEGIGLVRSPSYEASVVEARARARLGTLRGRVPTGRALDCRCSPGNCVSAVFEEGSLDGTIDKDEVLAIADRFSDVLASKRRGGVRFWQQDGDLEYAVDVPNSERGAALLETMKAAEIIGRPVLDTELSEVVVEGVVARYSRAEVRAILLSPTDANKGWTPVVMEPTKREAAPRRRWVTL